MAHWVLDEWNGENEGPESYITASEMLAWLACDQTNPCLIPSIPSDPRVLRKIIPEFRARRNPGVSLGTAPKLGMGECESEINY